jgi:protein gp37
MAENSAIEWTDHTFNPWEGCQKIGPGCDGCYAEARNARFGTPKGQPPVAMNWGPGAPRRRTSASNWRKPHHWQADAARFLAEHGRRQRVFCASLADVFDNAVDSQWRRDLAVVILLTPDLDWLLLTKRIGNALDMLIDMFPGGVPDNVHPGATIVSQDEWDRDATKIARVATACGRGVFLSMEPLLGAVNLGTSRYRWQSIFSWVIAGGESGAGARPMHPDWVRSLRDQCAAAGVPFLFKQWGEFLPVFDRDYDDPDWRRCGGWQHSHPRGRWHNLAGGTGFHGDRVVYVDRPGKKAAGRLLDGVEHNGFPMEHAA